MTRMNADWTRFQSAFSALSALRFRSYEINFLLILKQTRKCAIERREGVTVLRRNQSVSFLRRRDFERVITVVVSRRRQHSPGRTNQHNNYVRDSRLVGIDYAPGDLDIRANA